MSLSSPAHKLFAFAYGSLRNTYYQINDCPWLIRLASRPRHLITALILSLIRPTHLLLGEPRTKPGWFSCSYTFFSPYLFDLTVPISPSSFCNYIVLDNVLEHIPRSKLPIALRTISRMLKPGGVVRIIVPSANAIASYYLSQNHSSDHLISDFATNYGLDYCYRVDVMKLAFHDFGHGSGSIIDIDMLRDLLSQAGLRSVNQTPLGAPRNLVFSGLDNRSSWFDQEFSLCVEAVKG